MRHEHRRGLEIAELFTLRPAGGPIWKQIEESIRRVIASRQLRPGDPVPSVRQLARTLSVTPNTVERAYQRLIVAGVERNYSFSQGSWWCLRTSCAVENPIYGIRRQ